MLSLLMLVPVASVIVSHFTAISAFVRSQLEVNIHFVVTELLILIKPFTTLFTFKFLEVIIQMNSFVVFLYILN